MVLPVLVLSFSFEKMVSLFNELFSCLASVGYAWSPVTPEQVLRLRKRPSDFSAVEQRFGLGLPVESSELEALGFSKNILASLDDLEAEEGRLAVSLAAHGGSNEHGIYVLHHHWPPQQKTANGQYAHYGAESRLLTAFMMERQSQWSDSSRVLDLGASTGGLSLSILSELSPGVRIVGIDPCERAVSLGNAGAQAQGLGEVVKLCVGKAGVELKSQTIGLSAPPDLVVFNPPMMIPDEGADYQYRDGGTNGLTLPILFLQTAARVGAPGTKIFCLVTNPIDHGGRGLFFEELNKIKTVKLFDRCRLNPHFNQAVVNKSGGTISRVELWALQFNVLP